MPQFTYSQWDGSQSVADLDVEEVMDALAREALEGTDLARLLRRLAQKGFEFSDGRRLEGLERFLQRLREARQQAMRRHNLGSLLDDLGRRLDDIVAQEHAGIERRLNEGREQARGGDVPEGLQKLLEQTAARKQQQLDELPPDVGGRIKALSEYEFLDESARGAFRELLAQLQQQVLGSYFQGLRQGLESLTPADLNAIREMARDLNRMLEQRRRGEEPDFQAFLERHGHFFPPGLKSLDELLEHLAEQMALMDSLLRSMPDEMRQELDRLVDALMGDPAFRAEMERLARNLGALMPGRAEGSEYPFQGDEPLTLSEALRMMERLHDLDGLEEELRRAAAEGDPSGIDLNRVGRALGAEAQAQLDALRELLGQLETAGYLKLRGDDVELTARGFRRIGQRALQDIFAQLHQHALGRHPLERPGPGGDREAATKPYVFGDPFLLDVQQTLSNSIRRQGPGLPVHLAPGDFEVFRTESTTRAATVLLVDMSASMMYGGRFQSAKRVALALGSLLQSRYPRDALYLVAFSYLVIRLQPEQLLHNYWVEYGGGTNIQQALQTARQLLAGHRGWNKHVVLITDGEPTTYSGHRFRDGWWRRDPMAWEATLREVKTCARDGIVVNAFMLAQDPELMRFVQLMAKVNHGRVFFISPDELGSYVLHDFVNQRRVVRR